MHPTVNRGYADVAHRIIDYEKQQYSQYRTELIDDSALFSLPSTSQHLYLYVVFCSLYFVIV